MQDIQLAIELGVDLMKDIVAAGYSFLKEKNKEWDFFGAATKKYVGGPWSLAKNLWASPEVEISSDFSLCSE